MALAIQTVALLKAARRLVEDLDADAVLFLTQSDLDWHAVRAHLPGCKLLVVAQDPDLTEQRKDHNSLTVLELDPGPTPTQEFLSLAILEAVATEKLRSGAHVIALFNGIDVREDQPQPIDSISVIHLGEHLERLTAQDLRKLDTQV